MSTTTSGHPSDPKLCTPENLPGFVKNICQECGVHVAYKSRQLRHARGHLSEEIPGNLAIKKPFACPHCDKRFATKPARKVHIDTIHFLRKPHACPEEACDAAFSDPANLYRHRQQVHGWVSPKARGPLKKAWSTLE